MWASVSPCRQLRQPVVAEQEPREVAARGCEVRGQQHDGVAAQTQRVQPLAPQRLQGAGLCSGQNVLR